MFLRQALESRLIALYVDMKQYTSGLTMANSLLKELKKIDDKALLVEVRYIILEIKFCHFWLWISEKLVFYANNE